MIKVNGIEVKNGFSGTIDLGESDKIFVSGDGSDYSVYGTVFRVGVSGVVLTPNQQAVLPPGSIETFLSRTLNHRKSLSRDLERLEGTRRDLLDGKYDYGVSDRLTNILSSLSFNTTKQLPSMVVGGKLGYEDLEKSDSTAAPFETLWSQWSNVENGPKRYGSGPLSYQVTSDRFDKRPSSANMRTVPYELYDEVAAIMSPEDYVEYEVF